MATAELTLEGVGPSEATAGAASPDGATEGRRRGWVGRAVAYLTTLGFLITINFFLPRAMPGSPLDALVSDPHSPSFVNDPSIRAALAHYYGLDGSLWSQFIHYLTGLAHGNLGVSITSNTPVGKLIAEHVPWSALLIVSGMLLSTLVAVVAGVHSGWKGGDAGDSRLLGFFIFLGYGPIVFLVAPLLFYLAVKLPIFPLSGGSTPFAQYSLAGQVADVAHHLILPAMVMALQFVGYQYLLMRGAVVSELGADYLRLGRAKGLLERRIKYRYAARNALLPLVSATGVQLGFAVGASIIVERLFAWPGLGNLMFTASGNRDYPTMQGCFLVLAVLVLTVNLLTDLAYARLDPRTRT